MNLVGKVNAIHDESYLYEEEQYELQTYHKSWGMPHSKYLERNVQIARMACRKRFQKIDYEDMDQELYLKALQFDEMDHIERPALVMASLLNHIRDYVRKESMYRKKFELGREDSEELMNVLDCEFVWTPRLLGAALVAFLIEPSLLPPVVKDQVYRIYKVLTRAEHDVLLQRTFFPITPTISYSYSRLVKKYSKELVGNI